MRSIVVVTPASTNPSPPVIVDQHLTPQHIGIAAVVSGGASLTYDIQFSFNDPFAVYATDYNTNATWLTDKNMTSLTATKCGVLTGDFGQWPPAVRAIRAKNSGYTSGNVTLTVVQVGGIS